jgi:hypothetical protein
MTQLDICKRDNQLVFGVKVKPNARKNAIGCIHAGYLKLEITATPEQGKANKAICAFLAKELGIAKSQVVIITGGTSKLKKIQINGMTKAELRKKLNLLSSV